MQGKMRPSTRLQPRLGVNSEGVPVVEGISRTNKILLNKTMRPGQLPTLSDYGRQRMMEAGDQLDPALRLAQGPPAMAMTGFEGGHCVNQKNLEMARSKFLLDKLTNKLPPELRRRAGKLPPIPDRPVSGLSNRD
jgi:hypothetical protein